MGVLFMASPDLQDVNLFSLRSTNTVTSTDYHRTGSRSFRHSSGNHYQLQQIPDTNEGYFKVAYNDSTFGVRLYEDSTIHLELYLTSTYVRLYRGGTGGTQLLTDYVRTNPPAPGMDLYEGHWLIDDSVGVFQIKLNGALIFDFSGDTRNGGAIGTVDEVRFWAYSDSYYDDIVIRDDQWPGRGGVYVLVPDSGSTTENWVASAGNPEDCVDEIPVSTADYIATPHLPSGVGHLFNMSSPPVSGEVQAVAALSYAYSESATDSYCRNIIRSGSAMASGEYVGVDTGPRWVIDYFDTDPATAGAWSYAAIEALEMGLEN